MLKNRDVKVVIGTKTAEFLFQFEPPKLDEKSQTEQGFHPYKEILLRLSIIV